MPVDLPILGHVELPRPEELAYYVGLAVLAAAEILTGQSHWCSPPATR